MSNSIPGWISAIFGPVRIYVAGTLLGFRPRSSVNFVGATIEDDEANDRTNFTLTGFTAPTGTGIVTVTSGALDAASTATTGTGNVVRATAPTVSNPQLSQGCTWTGVTANNSTGTLSDVSLGGNKILSFTNASGPTVNSIDATGISDGQEIIVYATAGNIVLKHETGATAANRIDTGGVDMTLPFGPYIRLRYLSSRWRVPAGLAV